VSYFLSIFILYDVVAVVPCILQRKRKNKAKDAGPLTDSNELNLQSDTAQGQVLINSVPLMNSGALILQPDNLMTMSAEDIVRNLPRNKQEMPKEKKTIASRDEFRANAVAWRADMMENKMNKCLRRANGPLPQKSPSTLCDADREIIKSTLAKIIETPCKCGKPTPCYAPLEPHLQPFLENMVCMKQKERIYVMKCFLMSTCLLRQTEVCNPPIQYHCSILVQFYFFLFLNALNVFRKSTWIRAQL
jgi:hypothetical protein